MSRTSRCAGVLVAALSFASVAVAVAAPAKPFKPASKQIVPGKSIGGVTIGQSPAKAKAAWHGAAACNKPVGSAPLVCDWVGSAAKGQGVASYIARAGRVTSVSVIARGGANGTYVFKAPLTTLRTTKGIGLGSAQAAVVSAYPNAKLNETPSNLDYDLKQGAVTTTFEVDRVSKRVTFIAIVAGT